MDLFSLSNNISEERLDLPNADIVYYKNFLSEKEADNYFISLQDAVSWRQDAIKLFGKTYPQPRLTALFGDEGKTYSYSSVKMHAVPFTPKVSEIKHKVEKITNTTFNSVLLNLYRDGQDSNGWHSDDEKELGNNPVIASVSLGTKRVFQLKHKSDSTLRYNIALEHGSLLLMKGETQHFWKHQIPKSKKIIAPRINLTFRILH